MKFSITIPAYKRKYLKECIESVLAQTYTDFELIIVNDASPEDLEAVVNEFHDTRIHYYRNKKNCGAVNVVDNWNICLSYATGDYVICMGDDDRLLPCCLAEYARLAEQYPGIGVMHGWTEIIDEHSVVTALTTHRCNKESAVSLAWHRFVGCYAYQFIGDFCFHTEWLRSQGGFYKLPLAWGSDDISAIIGAMRNGVANTSEPVFQYRRNSLTISSTGNRTQKMQALMGHEQWLSEFLNTPTADTADRLYAAEILERLPRHFAKRKALLIGSDGRHHKWRYLYWFRHRKRFAISRDALLYGFLKMWW